jgi:prolipoprotein diacylglyceryltransferase
MSGTLLHVGFDIAAWLAAGLCLWWYARRIAPAARPLDLAYAAALMFGAGVGAVMLGSLNLWLSGQTGLARSIEGAIAGAIVAIELYKRAAGITSRTGARYALALAVGVAIGRIGCFLAGLDDFTYGTPTSLPWGHDFGDGIARHPVQLYEAASMTGFALLYVLAARRRNPFVLHNGFYLAIGCYGLQRFAWEFLKPYGTLVGPFTLFHVLSLAILAYAAAMIATDPQPGAADDRAFA